MHRFELSTYIPHGAGFEMTEKPSSKDKKKQQGSNGFQDGDDHCVWMKAKVVSLKLCDQAYDCLNCRFDRAMREAWAQESTEED